MPVAKKAARQAGSLNRDWVRGYFCAVAVLLKEEGQVNTTVRSLFDQCGHAELADPEDLALFREYGLVK